MAIRKFLFIENIIPTFIQLFLNIPNPQKPPILLLHIHNPKEN